MGKMIDIDAFHKRYMFHAENKAEAEFNQIINELKKTEAIPKDNVYIAIQELMKYEHEGFINISLARLDEILKKCGVIEDEVD